MHPYLILIAGSCLICAICAGCVIANDPRRRPNQLAGLVLLSASFWAMCEIFWNLAVDPDIALWRMRLAALGWAFIGPLFFHLVVSGFRPGDRSLRRILPLLYGISAAAVLLTMTTDWMIPGVVSTRWGWGYQLGPGFFGFYLLTQCEVGASALIVVRDFRDHRSPAERRQGPWIALGMALPLMISTMTDVVFPWFGIQVPRLGTTSFAMMGLVAVWTLFRFGYSFMTPGTFAHEILATLPDGVALIKEHRIGSTNEGLVRLSGYSAEELSGMSIETLLIDDRLAPHRAALDQTRASIDAPIEERECQLAHAAGGQIPVSISASALGDRQGFPIGTVLVIRDLREVADLRSRLVMSGRLAAVGELAAGIAHEINNPLAFVRTNLSQLQGHWKTIGSQLDGIDDDEQLAEVLTDGREMIEESLEGVNRAAEIVRGVQGFSHQGGGTREAADLHLLLDSVIRMAATQFRDRARVESHYADLPPIYCAPQELKQVFLNLILNAGHAVGDSGLIRLQTEREGDAVAISVEDDGCGIAPEVLDRIFDPFFTTKPVGDGTGLGLGIAYQIVRSHGGEIRVDSRPGVGACFRVVLPLDGKGRAH
jgi:PAS domain S-box-containing protein